MPTLVSFREVMDGRDGGVALSSGDAGALTNGTYTRSFVAEFLPTDGPSGPDEAGLTPGVPSIGDVYVSGAGLYDSTCFCVGVKAVNYHAPWVWLLTCSYSSDVDLSNPSGDPLLMPPRFSWGSKTATRPAKTFDAAGNPVACLNSAGDPFDPPPTDEETWTTLEVSRNLASFDFLTFATYRNAVNLDAWLGFQPGEVLCVDLSDDTEYVKGVVIHRVKGKFEIKRKGGDSWALVLLDRGWQGYDAAGNRRVFVDQATGRTLPGASLLDGTGKQLPKGGTPAYKTFYVKNRATFSNLGLV